MNCYWKVICPCRYRISQLFLSLCVITMTEFYPVGYDRKWWWRCYFQDWLIKITRGPLPFSFLLPATYLRPLSELWKPLAEDDRTLISLGLWMTIWEMAASPICSPTQYYHMIKKHTSRGAWVAHSVKCLTSAQVMISQFVSSNADSPEPGACFRFCLPLSLPLPRSCSVSLSQK